MMAPRTRLLLLIAALLAAAGAVVAAVPAVPITIVWDNTADEVMKQAEPETRANIAKILCNGIPREDVVLPPRSALVDESSLVDSKTTGRYLCKARDGRQETAIRIFSACNAAANQRRFNDQMEDDTDFPELEMEKVTCDPKFVNV